MCGIAGLIGTASFQHQDAVRRMMNAIAHRGPDGEGLYAAASGQCVLGHRRLSILDLSSASAQPMASTDGRYHLSYNGEIYNFSALRAQLKQAGIQFRSKGDTEVLLQVLATWGEQGLARVNGMFALAFWDEHERTLLLARDQFGQKPLYWSRVAQGIVFASEIRAILASGLVPGKLDQAGLLGYLSYGAVQEPNTIIKNVQALPRSCYFLLSAEGKGSIQRFSKLGKSSRIDNASDLRDLFAAAVKRHLVSDVPVGCFLSGGLDSSAIVAAAVHGLQSQLHTLSVVFPDAIELSEQSHAKRIAEKYHTRHQEIPINNDGLRSLSEKAIQAMDQPTGDAVNTFIVAHAAVQAGLKVALSGLGGDELFGGYPSFADIPKMVKFQKALHPAGLLFAKVIGMGDAWDRRKGKLKDYFEAPRSILNNYLTRRRAFTSRQIGAVCHLHAQSGWISGIPIETSNRLEACIRDMVLPDAIACMELEFYLGNMLLRDTDSMGMWHSLEIRAPFLDAEFSGAILSLEPDVRVPRKLSKWKLVEILGDWLPAGITQRSKQGFVLPFERWLSGSWRDEVEEELKALPKLMPCDTNAIQDLWSAFLKAPGRVGWFRVWQLYVLSHYLRRNHLAT